jgi:hypothetical protein
MANRTARGVIAPAKTVAAPSEAAVATAGAMWVMDWNATPVAPTAFRSRLGDSDVTEAVAMEPPPVCSCDRRDGWNPRENGGTRRQSRQRMRRKGRG